MIECPLWSRTKKCLTEKHFPSYLPPTETKSRPSRRCVVCTVPVGTKRTKGVPDTKRHETRFGCTPCGVALCVVPCFRLYHSHTDYKRAYRQQVEVEQ